MQHGNSTLHINIDRKQQGIPSTISSSEEGILFLPSLSDYCCRCTNSFTSGRLFYLYKLNGLIRRYLSAWTDAWRPVPRLWLVGWLFWA